MDMKRSAVAPGTYPVTAIPFLKSVEDGSQDQMKDLRTPLFDERPREEVAQEWYSILSKHFVSMKGLEEIELKQQGKLGPLSLRLPFSDRIESVEEYYQDSPFTRTYDYISDLGHLKSAFKPNNMRPDSLKATVANMPLSTSSGLPEFRKKNIVVEESLEYAKKRKSFPSMLGWSSSLNGPIPKQRVVWMFPFSTNIVEGSYCDKFTKQLVSTFPYFASYISMDSVDEHITKIFKAVQTNTNVVILSSDFSGYDQSLKHMLVWYFDFLRYSFQHQYVSDIEWLENELRTIELLCTRKVLYSGSHGMPSGSKHTYIANTIINIEAQLKSTYIPERFKTLIQATGDDAVNLVTNVDKHIQFLQSLGFRMNSDKQFVSKNSCIYLQRYYERDYVVDGVNRGVYPTMRALNSLLGKERFHTNWNKELETLRTISILENCKWHPAFNDFVKFVKDKGDKYLMENLHSILSNEQKVTNIAKSIPGFIPSYTQITRFEKGLNKFATVKALYKT